MIRPLQGQYPFLIFYSPAALKNLENGFESSRLRNFSKRVSEPKIWSARSAVCSAFPPQNPDSARIRHAPRGSSFVSINPQL